MNENWINKKSQLWYEGSENKVYYCFKQQENVTDQYSAAIKEIQAFYGIDFIPILKDVKKYKDSKKSAPLLTLYEVYARQSVLDERLPETKEIKSRNDYYKVFDPTGDQQDQDKKTEDEAKREEERRKQLEDPYVKEAEIKSQKKPYAFGDILKEDIITKETKEEIQNQFFGKMVKDPKTGKETFKAGGLLREKIEKNTKTAEQFYTNILDRLSLKNIIGISLSQFAKWLNGEPVDVECVALNFKNSLLCASVKDPKDVPKSFEEAWSFPDFKFDLSALDTEQLAFDFLKVLETTVRNIIQDFIFNIIDIIYQEFAKILDGNFNFNKYILPCKENSLDSIFDKTERKTLEEVLDVNNKDFEKTFKNDILSKNLQMGYKDYLSIVDETLKNLTPRELDGLYNGIISGDAFDLLKDIVNKYNGNQNLDDAEYISLFTNYKSYVYDFTTKNESNYIFTCNHPSFIDAERQALVDQGFSEDEAQDFIDTKKAAWLKSAKEMCNFLRNSVKTVETKEEIDPTTAYRLVVGKNIDNIFDSIEKNLQSNAQTSVKKISSMSGDLSIAANYLYPIKDRDMNDFKFIKTAINQTKPPEPPGGFDIRGIIDFFDNMAETNQPQTFYEKFLDEEDVSYNRYTYQSLDSPNRWVYISAIENRTDRQQNEAIVNEEDLIEDKDDLHIFVLESNKILYYDKDNVNKDDPGLLFNGFSEIILPGNSNISSLTELLLQKCNQLPQSYRDSLVLNKTVKDSDIFFEVYRAIEADADLKSIGNNKFEFNISYDLFFEALSKNKDNLSSPFFRFINPEKDSSLKINQFNSLKFLNFEKIKIRLKKELKVIR
jgi:hypothetical protein